MSRHDLLPFDPRHAVVIGWDPPLRTYFLQVLDTSADDESDDYTILWIGTGPREIPDAVAVVGEAARYAEIPADLLIRLVGDRHDNA